MACWANIDKNSGSKNTILNIYSGENETGADRSVRIKVSSPDGKISGTYTLVHKKKGQPVYKNVRKSKTFVKEGCDPTTEKGETMDYEVPAGKYKSTVSQLDADRQADEEIAAAEKEFQKTAKCNTVLWYNTEQTRSFQKTDCDAKTEEGTYVSVTEPAGSHASTISQADANMKAIEALNQRGPGIANAQGSCKTVRWCNDEQTGSFQKTDCLVTETGSFVPYTIAAGRVCSTVSKNKANEEARALLESEGQENANRYGECKTSLWYNTKQSRTYTKSDCADGYIGTSYTYTVEAGKYSSTISQADADRQATEEINTYGQSVADANMKCEPDPNYYIGKATGRVQKNDCDSESQTGSWVDFTEKDLDGYPTAFVSRTSQAEADELASAAMDKAIQDGSLQSLANERGNCEGKQKYIGVYSTDKYSKNNCTDGGTGSNVTVTQDDVNCDSCYSYVSQEDANNKAKAVVEAAAQDIANTKGTCTWRGSYSAEFTKECEEGQTGTTMTITEKDVQGYPFTSTENLAAANKKAEDAVKSQGQAIVNNQGTCENDPVYIGRYEKTYTPNCPDCQSADPMVVSAEMINGSPVTASSQQEADAKAQEIVTTEVGGVEAGQNYADKNAECKTDPAKTQPVWVDSNPLETECRSGVSYKKQVNTNACYTGTQEQWVEGGGRICTWSGEYSEEFTKECTGSGVGSKVVVDQTMVSGDITSTVSQEDANNKAKALVKAQGQAVANKNGECVWTGQASANFTPQTCGSCRHGVEFTVTQDDIQGHPFTSTVSQADADSKASEAVTKNGQAYANTRTDKCEADSTDPVWVDTDPLQTECRNGKSYKKQTNTNACYGGSNEQWVEGGDKECLFYGKYSAVFYKDCGEGTSNCGSGANTGYTVDQTMVSGDITSTVSQEDANAKAKTLVEAQGQAIAEKNCTCMYVGKAQTTVAKNDCGDCKIGTQIVVSIDQLGLDVSLYSSSVSQDAANQMAEAIMTGDTYKDQIQAVANKNGVCVENTEPNWVNISAAAGGLGCNGCTPTQWQRDANECSPTYNTTREIEDPLKQKDCSLQGELTDTGETQCQGYDLYHIWEAECGGTMVRLYESKSEACGCGEWGSWFDSYSCGSGAYATYVRFQRSDNCGRAEYDYRQIDGRCGYEAPKCNLVTTPDGSEVIEVDASAGSLALPIIAITSNYSNVDDSDISVSVTTSGDVFSNVSAVKQTNGNYVVMARKNKNSAYTARTGSITITQNSGGCKLSKTINYSQKGQDPVYEFTGGNSVSFEAAGGNLSSTVHSTKNDSWIDYTYSGVPSWITVTYGTPGSTNNNAFGMKAAANTSTSSRSATITLTQKESGKTLTVTVTQAGANPTPAYIKLSGGAWTQRVKNNVDYVTTSGQCIAGFSLSGDENGTISFYVCDIKVCDANYTEIPDATIAVRSTATRNHAGNSCTWSLKNTGAVICGYKHSGDETATTTWTIRNYTVTYDGKTYTTNSDYADKTKEGVSKTSGSFNVYNESPAALNFLKSAAECGDENGTMKFQYGMVGLTLESS